jgi:hypothetical protein
MPKRRLPNYIPMPIVPSVMGDVVQQREDERQQLAIAKQELANVRGLAALLL